MTESMISSKFAALRIYIKALAEVPVGIVANWSVTDALATLDSLASHPPIAMRLPCERCGNLHIDVGEFATKPHHTHRCQYCGLNWRPAKEHTVGVQFIPGFKNDNPPAPIPHPIDWSHCWGKQGLTSEGLGSQANASEVATPDPLCAFKEGDWVQWKDGRARPFRVGKIIDAGDEFPWVVPDKEHRRDRSMIDPILLEPWAPVVGEEFVKVKSALGNPIVPEYGVVVGSELPLGAPRMRFHIRLAGCQRLLPLSDLEPADRHAPSAPTHPWKAGDWVRLADPHLPPVCVEHVNSNSLIELKGGARILSQYLMAWVPAIGESVVVKGAAVAKVVEINDGMRDQYRIDGLVRGRQWFYAHELEPAPASGPYPKL